MVIAMDLANLPSVGVAPLDDDHRIILGIIIELQEAITGDDDPETLSSMVYFLSDHIMTHLRREERLMKKLNYPEQESHIRDHAALIAWNNTFRASFMESGSSWLTTEKLLAPAEWWLNHITTVDILYKDFFAAHADEVAIALSTENLFEIYGFDTTTVDEDDPLLSLSLSR